MINVNCETRGASLLPATRSEEDTRALTWPVSMGSAASASGLRMAELLATLSLSAGLGLGQPLEHVRRSCPLACGWASALTQRRPAGGDLLLPLLACVGYTAE
jgi:hypothetical protein